MLPRPPVQSQIAFRTTLTYLVTALLVVVIVNFAVDEFFPNSKVETAIELAIDITLTVLTGLVVYTLIRRETISRNKVEAALSENAELLAQAASVAHIGTWHWDYATNKLSWSDEMFTLFGVTRAEFDGDPNGVVQGRVHPADLDRMLSLNQQVLATQQPITAEYRIVLPSGEIRTLEGHGSNVYDSSGKAIGLLGIVQDITDRKKAEDELHLQGAALVAAANAIVITDRDGTISWVNPAFTTLSGYSLADILGKNIRVLNTSEHDAAAYESLWATILSGEVWQGEVVNQRQDGSLYIEELTVTPVRDSAGALTHFVAISQDVSERRQAANALRESEARFRTLAERIPDVIYRFKVLPEPGLEYVSPAITAITGYTPEELYEHPRLLGQGVLPEDRQLFAVAELQSVLILRVRHKAGHVVWLEQRHVPELNEAGQIVAVDGVARDITEQVKHQKEVEAIAQISTVLRTAATRTEMVPRVMEQVRSLVGASDVSFIVPDSTSNDLIVEFGEGEYLTHITGLHLKRGDNISSRVLETGRPYVTEDVHHDPNFKWLIPPPPEVWAAVCVPLLIQKDAIGVIWAYHTHKFTSDEVQLLGVLANITASALQRVTLYDEAKQRSQQLSILNETGNALAEILDLPQLLHRLAQSATKLLPDINALYVLLYDAETSSTRVTYGLRNNEAVDVSQLTLAQIGSNGLDAPSVINRTGQPLILNDLKVEAKTTEVNAARSAMYVPLKAKGAIIGLLQVQSDQPGRFGPPQAELLGLIASSAAIAIQNARLFTENMERLETITALYVSAQKLSFDRDLSRMTHDVVRTCVESYGAQSVWLARVENDKALRPLAYHPTENPFLEQLGDRWNESVSGSQNPARRAVDTGFPVIIKDLQNDGAFEPWAELANTHEMRSCIALPLISRDEAVGVLVLFSKEVGFFKPRRQSFLQAYAHHVAVALENTRLIAETSRRLQQLQSLRAIDAAITGSLDLRLNLKIILDQVITQLGSDAADLLILNKNTLGLEFTVGRGFMSNLRQSMRLQVGQGFAGRVALTRRPLSIPNLSREPFNDETVALSSEGFASYYGMPLIAKGQVTGVLEIFHRRPFSPDAEWLEFLKSLTEQSAIAIDNATLFAGLQRNNLELALAYDATIEGLSRMMDMRDKEDDGHTQRVTELAVTLGGTLGLSGEELMHLRRGGLLHDIGKLGVPDQILLKAEALTDDERGVLKLHPTLAYQMLSPIAYLRPALDIPYCHHERWDGSGYPRGLKGDQIPLPARIFAVVDVWDALISEKPYRAAWPPEKAREHLKAMAGIEFDPQVVEAFLHLVTLLENQG